MAQHKVVSKVVRKMGVMTPDEIAQIDGALAHARRAGDGQNEADGMEDGGKIKRSLAFVDSLRLPTVLRLRMPNRHWRAKRVNVTQRAAAP